MNSNVLILPGIGNSGPTHWQSRWQAANPSFRRVVQRQWDHPVCRDWTVALENAVSTSGPDTVLVAHSLACLLVAHWVAATSLSIRGALLVAPPDPEGPVFPKDAVGFSPLPYRRFTFPSTLVVSTDDPYSSFSFAHRCAEHWGIGLITIGAAGHINADSNLGDWPEGFALLRQLLD